MKFFETVEHHAARGPVESFGVVEVENGIFVRAEADAVVFPGKESASPEPAHERLALFVFRHENDKGGKIFVHGTEAVGKPRTNTGSTCNLGTRLHEGHAGAMVDRLGVHRFDHGDVIGNFRGVRETVTHPGAGFTVLCEGIGGTDEGEARLISGHAGETLPHANRVGKFLSLFFGQARLVVKKLDLRGTSRLEEKDDPFCLSRSRDVVRCRGGGTCLREETAEGETTEASSKTGESRASAHAEWGFKSCAFHGVFEGGAA